MKCQCPFFIPKINSNLHFTLPWLLISAYCILTASGWTCNSSLQSSRIQTRTHNTITSHLHLVPLSTFSQIKFLNEPEKRRLCIGTKGQLRPSLGNGGDDEYILGIALTQRDLESVAKLTYECFKQEIVVNYDSFSEWEANIIKPIVAAFEAYTDGVGYADILTGTQKRAAKSMNQRDDESLLDIFPCNGNVEGDGNGSSIILALTNRHSGRTIASVEVRLLVPDGKIPFSQPSLDELERKVVSIFAPNLASKYKGYAMREDIDLDIGQPYLCNLCVDESARGRGIGKALLRCVESLAKDAWKYNRLYLHVDPKNVPAYDLYTKEGYVDVGFRWDPVWAGRAVGIAYVFKDL